MDQDERDFIERIKKEEPSRGLRVRVSDSEAYRVTALGRGEMGFYQQNDRALLFEFSAGFGFIVKKSIRRWDDGKKVTDAEREVIIQRIADYLKAGGAQHVKIIE
ncbi:hypothetical protein [Myxococcus sp. AS-1-15]|uniref:hypothetical protein n=1 Tax=Myxococcus sp. AS-1-15 TaxID=2874600 RepID=UPI001CC19F25|nr:hypothetical protein [Myxococcus sp. AS-1-15]MBZ4400129.1 hypothetical protein [Myxococcus sp. AS-1-15]